MASLKEVKTRIQSVNSTRQITAAMKMVSSAKLHKAQKVIEDFFPYQSKLNEILTNFLNYQQKDGSSFEIPLSINRDIKKVAIVAVSSNTSLCGSFNSEVIKLLDKTVKKYSYLGKENVLIYPVGKKVAEANKNACKLSLNSFVDKPKYEEISAFADMLVNDFTEEKIDKIEFIYQHFKGSGSQILTKEVCLPFNINNEIAYINDFQAAAKTDFDVNYIFEPDAKYLLDILIPKVIRLKFYTVILDSIAAEHAARTVAMQIATENAEDLLLNLKLQYNKSRQQMITNELLDIVGGSIQ